MVELIEHVSGPTPEIFRERLLEKIYADLEMIAKEHGLGELLSTEMERLAPNVFEITVTDIDDRQCKVTMELRPIVLQ
jgi:hypothetical protein